MPAELVAHVRIRVFYSEGRRVAKLQAMDDFTIILPELTDMASCDVKVYEGGERHRRMVKKSR